MSVVAIAAALMVVSGSCVVAADSLGSTFLLHPAKINSNMIVNCNNGKSFFIEKVLVYENDYMFGYYGEAKRCNKKFSVTGFRSSAVKAANKTTEITLPEKCC
jgi:hypothetical protein